MKRTSADQVHMTGQSGTKARVSDAGFMSMHVPALTYTLTAASSRTKKGMLDAGFEAHHLYTNNAINANVVEKGVTDGFMLMIYGTSTGSLSIEQEGKMELTNRGY
ncbi:hypothetical protein PPROV_000174400 [Pycnococcus provasolii]|uniref:Uncharacterized protein n=1 Tax=Pycnococcus provasolii TaxID=41880 RepID=A0A830HCC1_9CHLO|nr:hypothetical protein PPROV_000174400 [Pycnococcus provasolii]